MSFLLSIPNLDFQMSIHFIDIIKKKIQIQEEKKNPNGYQQCYT